MRNTPTTCFRVEVQRPNGLWAYLFDCDFTHAVAEVRRFKARGIPARFKGGDGQKARKATPKRRTHYQAVR